MLFTAQYWVGHTYGVSEEPLATGVMDLLILSIANRPAAGRGRGKTDRHEIYGYEVALDLAGHGLADVSEASVYTSLRRLERNGLLRSRRALADNGRARRYYSLTPAGAAELAARRTRWTDLAKTVDSVLDAEHRPAGPANRPEP